MKTVLLLLLNPCFIFSQTIPEKAKIISQTNTQVLKLLSKKNAASFFENKEKAILLSKAHHWPLSFEKDSTFSELMEVSKEHLPIYYATYNYGAGVTSRTNTLYTGGSLGLAINGENMTAAIWDAGAAMPSHDLFSGRVQIADNSTNTHYHATHIAGTIIGTDQVEKGAARGMAYKGNLISYDWNNDISEVAVAAANGLLVSNHSYGRNPSFVADYEWGKYDLKAQAFDEIMFNAPYYQFVCAAGNARGSFNLSKNGYDLVNGHGLCKNGITVAAVNEVLNYSGPSSVVMTSFSSWGPTDDGRIKPDISAKGLNTFSAIDTSENSYGILSGTSTASPSVAGTLLLLQQYYKQLNGSFMKAATLKGLMIHTADEAGVAPGPDYSYGWGLLNAEKAATIITKNHLQSFIIENSLTQNIPNSIAINAMGNEPLLATLCWTDPKGILPDTSIDNPTPVLVNDLDIRITQNENTFFPWKLNGAKPKKPAEKGDNTVDNVEKIEINNPTGIYTITISNKGNLLNNLQEYSLIISGISIDQMLAISYSNAFVDSVLYYPNPVDAILTVKSKTPFTKYELYDLNSRLILEQKTNAKEIAINCTTLATGVYFVKLFQTDGILKNIRILKN